MPTLSYVDSNWSVCEIVSGQGIYMGDVTVLLRAILAMHAIVPLTRVQVNATDLPATPADYKITAVDGRIWRQKLLDATTDPPMTFTHNDAWKLSEFEAHRAIRDAAVDLLANHELQSLDCRPV